MPFEGCIEQFCI